VNPPAPIPQSVEIRGVENLRLGPFVVGRSTLLLLLGAVVGVFAGAAAVLYRALVQLGNGFWEGGERGLGATWAIRLFFPALGGLLVGFVLRRHIKEASAHGIPSVIRAVQRNRVLFPWRMLTPSIASVLILMSGGSAGPEGPIAEIGSVFGAKTGRIAHVHRRMYRTLVAAGVAAGISAIFSAPIGGVLFAIEVILLEFEVVSFAPVVIASVVASLFSHFAASTAARYGVHLLVVEPAIEVHQVSINDWEIPYFALVGLAMGILSIGFIRFLDYCTRAFRKIPISPWLYPAVGGLMVGLMGIWLPQVLGEGYAFLNNVLNKDSLQQIFADPQLHALLGNREAWLLLVAVLVGKFVAISITLGSGAPGGSFAPALFLGAVGGTAMGYGFDWLTPSVVGHSGSYGLVGMAAVIAGAFNAPMTGLMIMFHAADGEYSVLLPLMTAVAVSIAFMSRWGNVSLYTSILRKQGEWSPPGAARDPLYGLVVGDILKTNVPSLPALLSVASAMQKISELDEANFVVEDEAGHYLGLLSLADLRLALADPMMGQLISLADIIDPDQPGLEPQSTLSQAIRVFSGSRREALPVFEDSPAHRLLGIVTRSSVIDAYRDSRGETRYDA